MIELLVLTLSLTAAGLPAAALLDRRARGAGLIGLAFLVGSGVVAMVMLLLSVVAIKWSLFAVASPCLALAASCLFLLRRRGGVARTDPPPTILSLVVDGATIVCVGGYTLYATMAAPWEWDFWAIWGLKARVFLLSRGVDWQWLAEPFNDFAHPDYPPLLPLLFDFVLLASGEWNDRWLGLLFVGFAAAVIALVRDLLLRSTGDRNVASIGALIATGTALSTWLGMAEIPLIAYTGAGLLYLREGEKRNVPEAITCGSVLLGLAALTKNEGVAFLVAAAVAAAVAFRFDVRKLLRLWPGAALAATWQLVRITHTLHNDLFVGDVATRVASKLDNLTNLLQALANHPSDRRYFWLIAIAVVLVGVRHVVRHERLLGSSLLLQLSFYLGAYVVTPHDVRWHVTTSWSRLSDQIALPLSILALFVVWRVDAEKEVEASHAA